MTDDGRRALRQTVSRLERSIRVEAGASLDALHTAHQTLVDAVIHAGRARGYAGDDPSEALAAASGADPDLHAVGGAAADLWLAFFGCFRPDEQAFEAVHFREAAAAINLRLAQVPAGERPDATLTVDLLATLAELLNRRHAAINSRLDDLISQVTKRQNTQEAALLASAQAGDELARVTGLINAAAEATAAAIPAGAAPATRLAAVLERMQRFTEAERRRAKETVAAFSTFLAAVRAAALGEPGPKLPPEADAVVAEVRRVVAARDERQARLAVLEQRLAELERERLTLTEELRSAAERPPAPAAAPRVETLDRERARRAVKALDRAHADLVRVLAELHAITPLSEDPARFRPAKSLLGLGRRSAFDLGSPSGLLAAHRAAGADLALYADRAAWGVAVGRFAAQVPGLRLVCRELVTLVANWRHQLGDPPPVSVSITLDGAEGVLALPAVLERDCALLLKKKAKVAAAEGIAPLLDGALGLYREALTKAGVPLPEAPEAGKREAAAARLARLTAALTSCATAARTAFAEAAPSGFRLAGVDADLAEAGHLLRAGLLALDEAAGEITHLPGVKPADLPPIPPKGDAPALASGIRARCERLDHAGTLRWEVA
jgi:hypothetical protein